MRFAIWRRRLRCRCTAHRRGATAVDVSDTAPAAGESTEARAFERMREAGPGAPPSTEEDGVTKVVF